MMKKLLMMASMLALLATNASAEILKATVRADGMC